MSIHSPSRRCAALGAVLATLALDNGAAAQAFFRQKWKKEPFGTLGLRFPNRWQVHNPVRSSGAGQPVSVQTGQAPLPDSTGLLWPRRASFVAAQGAIAEYFGT